MIYKYIVDTTATQVYSGPVKKAIIQVNAALTGNIKVIDNIYNVLKMLTRIC